MTALDVQVLADDFTNTSLCNLVSTDKALQPDISGMRIYDIPLIGYASADDVEFKALKNPQAVGSQFMLPGEWLPEAKTVISFFLPFTRRVRESNSRDLAWPSYEWMNARIEGQAFIAALSEYLQTNLEAQGYPCIVPCSDKRFRSCSKPAVSGTNSGIAGFTSNWSERHIAHICGLGTFSLSKGLITERGTAGRFGSVVTALELPPTPHTYKNLYENCLMCGVCAGNCPVGAISLEKGKDNALCKRLLDKTRAANPPYYGCGKCQIKVPCEAKNPVASVC